MLQILSFWVLFLPHFMWAALTGLNLLHHSLYKRCSLLSNINNQILFVKTKVWNALKKTVLKVSQKHLFFSPRLWAPDPQDAGPGPIEASVRGPDQGAQVDGSVCSCTEAGSVPAASVCWGRDGRGRVQRAGPSADAQPRHRPAQDYRGEELCNN